MGIVHPAVAIVARAEKAWANGDTALATRRAEIVVQQLILAGILPGKIEGLIPLAPERHKARQ